MIEQFDILKRNSGFSIYQSKLLSIIETLFNPINVNNLASESSIEISTDHVIVSVVHQKDKNTIITLNVYKKHATLWYSSCQIYFDENIDLNEFEKKIKTCLLGNYSTTDFYLKSKLILSKTVILGDEREHCTVPNTFFYKLIFLLFRGEIITKNILYKSFYG